MGLFDVDIRGFKQTLVGEAPRILCEPIANALDTEATEITVDFTWANGEATLVIEDNDPDGFSNLKDAYTLFAPSTRKGDVEKRGRFGIGEKEFVALCWPGEVEIVTTTGYVSFRGDERVTSRTKRSAGSVIRADFRLSRADADAFVNRVRSFIRPGRVSLEFNWDVAKEGGTEAFPTRIPVRSVDAILPTVHEDDDGNLRPTRRNTTVWVYEPTEGETPSIYELGFPVVTHDGRFHIDVAQKVPLNRNRDNVPPAYLRKLREVVLNATYDILTTVDVKKAWVTEALPKADPEALRAVVTGIHGKDAVIADPSNPDATRAAVDQGRSVIHGRQFPAPVWERIREESIFRPAGQVIETGVPTSPDGIPPIPEELWDEDMKTLCLYAREVGHYLLGFKPEVEFHNNPHLRNDVSTHINAWFGGRTISFNLGRLGKQWPGTAAQERIDALLIHEYAHYKARGHGDDYIAEACRLGAIFRGFKGRIR